MHPNVTLPSACITLAAQVDAPERHAAVCVRHPAGVHHPRPGAVIGAGTLGSRRSSVREVISRT
jgi:hypothetical protein